MTDFYVFKKNLAKTIRTCRRRMRVTQEDLGKLVGGVSCGAVSRWESGKNMPDAYNLYALAEVLGCTVDELLGRA